MRKTMTATAYDFLLAAAEGGSTEAQVALALASASDVSFPDSMAAVIHAAQMAVRIAREPEIAADRSQPLSTAGFQLDDDTFVFTSCLGTRIEFRFPDELSVEGEEYSVVRRCSVLAGLRDEVAELGADV